MWRYTAFFLVLLHIMSGIAHGAGENVDSTIYDIGSRRELFVDTFMIDRLKGAHQALHYPQPASVALKFDHPWEGVFSGYVTVIKDGETYRLYYRGLHASAQGKADHSLSTEVTCYAESRDGKMFTRPNLGLFEVLGKRDNNVVLAHNPACHNFCPFLDSRPGVPSGEQFKAVGGKGKTGLLAFASGDGIHWRPFDNEPIITKGAFDSQNVAFWSESERCYVCYFRTSKTVYGQRYRWISRTTSPDFLHWSEPVEMDMGDVPPEHYYTNQTHPYLRAPHIYVSIFARFMPGRQVVAPAQAEELGVVGDYSGDCSDAAFMATRGGTRYNRIFMESFIRPGQGPANWISRTNYPALGVVPTSQGEMSCYIQRHYAQPDHYLQRMTLRTDGFVSVRAPYGGGEMLTKLLTFEGDTLEINYATSAAGSIRLEIQDPSGQPISGYALDDAVEIIGDEIDRVVSWNGGADVAPLTGRPIRLRFVMRDADVYSIRFR